MNQTLIGMFPDGHYYSFLAGVIPGSVRRYRGKPKGAWPTEWEFVEETYPLAGRDEPPRDRPVTA